MPPPHAARGLYELEVAKHLLSLREALVRHDENLAAFRLLDLCTPHYLRRYPEVVQAHADQFEMVKHLFDPGAYAKAYEHNLGEEPFEEQFGGQLTIATANRVPRVEWLAQEMVKVQPRAIADLGCNDGWMLRHLADRADLDVQSVAGVDLNIDCVERARKRFDDAPGKQVAASFERMSIEDYGARDNIELVDAVSCFEVLEHVLDPYAVLDTARAVTRPGGLICISTPYGAIEQGWLPEWYHVRYKGHVRAVTPEEFGQWLVYAKTGSRMSVDALPDKSIDIVMSPDVPSGLMLGSVVRGE